MCPSNHHPFSQSPLHITAYIVVAMSSPLSFGDAYLMAKLAYTIAQTFTTGRKSAPAEFQEVENQLYSLSTALFAFKKALDGGRAALSPDIDPSPEGNGTATIQTLLNNCERTLRHLETIVSKYGEVSEKTSTADSNTQHTPLMKRWSNSLVKDYKKIAWTTEKGDLATLRSQLMVHTNSLDLVMGVIIK